MTRLFLVLLLLAGCGRSEVVSLGQTDADTDGGALPQKDADLPDADPGDIVIDVDLGVPDVPTIVDAGRDTGTIDTGTTEDAEVDTGVDQDAEPSPDGEVDRDTGVETDAGPNVDGGTPTCTTDNDCGFLGGHCDPATNTCVECYDDMHCAGQRVCDETHGHICRFPCFQGQCGPLGTCDPVENVCVECMQDADCGPGMVCNQARLECTECTTDADCALKPGRHLCDTTAGECRGCLADTDCATGEICVQLGGGVCVQPTGRGLCDPCAVDDDCGGPADLCIGIVSTAGLIDRTCAIDCSQNANVCPSGFECISVRNGEMQCRPRYDMQTPTCTATRHLTEACELDPNDVDPGCGIDGVQDARCESTVAGGAGQCVVWCQDDTDCANGTTCQPGTNGTDVCR